jgi:dienelactone hydrolase
MKRFIDLQKAFGMSRTIGVFFAAFLISTAVEAGEERFALRLASGTEVQVRLVRASHGTARLPAMVVLGGLERGSGVVDLIPRTTKAVVVGFDYPVAMPERVGWTEALPVARRLEKGIHETIESVGRLHELLARRADIDPARLSIVGVSLGAPFAVIGAAERDYRGVIIIDGFGDLPHTLRHQFARHWRKRYGVLGDALAWLAERGAVGLIDLPDPGAFARRLRANQQVYMISAEDDEVVPERSRQALQAALRQSTAQVTAETRSGGHVRGRDSQAISRLYSQASKWMRRRGLVD